jgi:hypothetical protein
MGEAFMRSTSTSVAPLLVVLMLAACNSSTGQNGCNLPVSTASITTSAQSAIGVVQRIKVGSPGNTPGGYDPYGQVDAYVTVPVSGSAVHDMVDIAIGTMTSVQVVQNGHAPVPISACEMRVNDKVMVWAALDGLIPGGVLDAQGDTLSLNDVTFGAQQIIIVRGE